VPEEAAAVAGKYLECAKSQDPVCAAKLFHYPADETVDERRADIEAVQLAIGVITNHFGRIESVRAAAGRFAYVEVAAGSADITYWQTHPESIKATYKTLFSKFGEGFVAVELCYISSRWEIRSVHYGLPAIDPRSTTRIMRVFDDLKGSAAKRVAETTS
jgi:hypothetical protein